MVEIISKKRSKRRAGILRCDSGQVEPGWLAMSETAAAAESNGDAGFTVDYYLLVIDVPC